MKLFILIFVFSLIAGLSDARSIKDTEKICLAVEEKSVTLPDFDSNTRVSKVSPDGRYLIYEKNLKQPEGNYETQFILFDSETMKKKELLSQQTEQQSSVFVDKGKKYDSGFSDDDSLVWIFPQDGFLRIWSLPDLKETILPMKEDRKVAEVAFLNDSFLFVEVESDSADALLKLESEIDRREKRGEPLVISEYFDLMRGTNLILRIVEFPSLKTSEKIIAGGVAKKICAGIGVRLDQFFFIDDDGSLVGIPLKGEGEPVKIFDSVSGMSFNDIEISNKCAFVGNFVNVIKQPEGKGYLIRAVEEKEEFLLPEEFLFFHRRDENGRVNIQSRQIDHLRKIESFIKYPFVITSDFYWPNLIHRVYHIPSGKTQKITDREISLVSPEGKLSVEEQETEGKRLSQLVAHPFNPLKRKIILELDRNSVCDRVVLNESGKSLIFSTSGDMFIFDLKTGEVSRHFVGQCPRGDVHVVSSGNTFSAQYGENYVVKSFREGCVEPYSAVPDDIEKALRNLAKSDDPKEISQLSLLMTLLEDPKTMQNYSELLREVMWNVLLHSPELFLDLYHHPSLNTLSFPDSYPDLDSNVETALQDSVKAILDLVTSQIHYSEFSKWGFLRALKPFLQKLPEEDKNFYIEKITASISNGAAGAIPLLQDVFQSKIYYVINGHVKELFGLDRQPVSDITVARKQQNFTTVILSSDPIEGYPSISTEFGLYYAVVEEASRDNLFEADKGSVVLDDFVEWSLSNGKQYRAKLLVNVKYGVITAPHQLDYDSIWQDHKMVGAVIVGSSLRGFSKTLLEEYLSYFEEQGFQFSKTEITNLKQFLLERIESCEIDYFLKESHSDGDERNVFRFDQANYVIRAVRYGDQGRIEVVYIIFPRTLNPEEKNTELLSNIELGQIIGKREINGCGQITYFNTSCWSHVKARYEIEEVNSGLFLNIPSLKLSDTFENTGDNVLRILLHAYRKGLAFREIREALKVNKGYKSEKRNHYIFPDEEIYKDTIIQHVRVPLNIHIELEHKEREVWQRIAPDEAL